MRPVSLMSWFTKSQSTSKMSKKITFVPPGNSFKSKWYTYKINLSNRKYKNRTTYQSIIGLSKTRRVDL